MPAAAVLASLPRRHPKVVGRYVKLGSGSAVFGSGSEAGFGFRGLPRGPRSEQCRRLKPPADWTRPASPATDCGHAAALLFHRARELRRDEAGDLQPAVAITALPGS